MTGFGEASEDRGGVSFAIEVRSVNHRYLKATVRLPEELAPLEAELEDAVRKLLGRGSVSVRCVCQRGGQAATQVVNVAALESYIERISEAPMALREHHTTIDLATLMTLPGVLEPPPMTERLGQARAAFARLLPRACEGVVRMREHEGRALEAELRGLCGVVTDSLAVVADRAPHASAEYERRLRGRIASLLPQADPVDVVREVAAYAERCDVNEEVSRLGGHVEQFLSALDGDGSPVGRKLDFIAQEMLREANTIASKTPDGLVSRAIIDAKAAIDRIKEQVQNVE